MMMRAALDYRLRHLADRARHVRLGLIPDLTFEAGTRFERGVVVSPHGGHITIGARCSINEYAVLLGHGGLAIGDDVLVAPHVVLVASNHNHQDPAIPIIDQGETSLGVSIGDGAWIAANATVLDGVTVGEGAIVGAGAVVNRDVPPYAVAAGVPATVKRVRR